MGNAKEGESKAAQTFYNWRRKKGEALQLKVAIQYCLHGGGCWLGGSVRCHERPVSFTLYSIHYTASTRFSYISYNYKQQFRICSV